MIIDGHQHVLKNFQAQKQINKKSGIDKVVLFSTLVHPETAKNRSDFTAEMNRLKEILSGKINPVEARLAAFDELLNAVKFDPEYFIGFGSCPFGMEYQETAEWIENRIIGNGLKGIGEITLGPGMVSLIENTISYLQESKKKLPIWIHTFDPLTISDIKELVEFAKKYDSVNFILGHSGGSNWLELIGLVETLPNVYIDISATFTVFSIKYTAETLPERCVFSSDLPYGDPFLGIKQIEYIIEDKYVRGNILGRNTENLLNG